MILKNTTRKNAGGRWQTGAGNFSGNRRVAGETIYASGEAMNHDALFKMLLKSPAILRGFFDAFLPDVAKFVDFNVLEFVDKERLTIEGRKRTGDLLIKTRFRGKAAAFLIHLEHQAQPDPGLGRRMLEYFMLDWRDFELPVYPIAKLAETPIGQEDKELVAGFFSKYQRLSTREALQLEREMSKVSLDMTKEKVIQLTNPFIELGIIRGRRQGREEGLQKGIHRGRQEGRQQGEVDLVLRMLRRRFGALTASQERAIRKLNLSRIEALGEALLEFTSRSDLARWLRPNS